MIFYIYSVITNFVLLNRQFRLGKKIKSSIYKLLKQKTKKRQFCTISYIKLICFGEAYIELI